LQSQPNGESRTWKIANFSEIHIMASLHESRNQEFTAYKDNSPYLDGRAPLVANQPEQRRYRARFVDDDLPVGDWSDVVEVTGRA
jgi:hypothetical protein